jgi:acetyl-CoA carboxylase carboxyltransferase component
MNAAESLRDRVESIMEAERNVERAISRVAAARNDVFDEGRRDALAAVHARGQLSARERIELLFDAGSFVEHGALARPADTQQAGPADGIVVGVGAVSGRPTAVISYDYTVMVGSQGVVSHAKLDHLLKLALRRRLPTVMFCEGAGARAQEMTLGNYGRRVVSFAAVARLSGQVPLVGIVTGRSFGGHASMAALSDLIVATRDSCMGIAGPPFVEAATGQRLTPEELGPAELHVSTGMVDVLVEDDEGAIAIARTYLELVAGPAPQKPPRVDGAALRGVLPDSPRHVYDVLDIVDGLVDEDSLLELRPQWARNVVTALARIDGRSVGIIANQPRVRAGAIDTDAADKMARAIRLCDSHALPIVFLVDTPGVLIGRASEETGILRHHVRPLMALAHAEVPIITLVIRKAYGLGYFMMGTRPFDPLVLAAWPTAEFGGMGLSGAASILDGHLDGLPAEIEAELQSAHTPLSFAAKFSIDDVIDPADTRDLIARTLRLSPPQPRSEVRRPIDPW